MFIHTTENHSWLRARWQALMTRLGADRPAADAAWDALVRHYSEPHRTYHNLSHVMALLRQADSERVHATRPEIVELAIWFHDVIYDTHAQDNELPTPYVADLPLFLDLDLAILGSGEESYRRYSQVIRAEFGWVPEQQYRAGRATVLRRFVERPALYFTPEMAERYEAQARQNIEWELQELEGT